MQPGSVHLSPHPPLTKGRQAQLGMTPAGGGSFRPYNHPPSPPSQPLGPPTASPVYAIPTSMLGCVAQSDTTRPKKCTCGGMLAPRRFSGGSTAHKCVAPNCGARFNIKKAPFYQCTNCLCTLCPICRHGRPQHAGTLPDEYVSKRKRDSLAASSSSQRPPPSSPQVVAAAPTPEPLQPHIPAGTRTPISSSPGDGFPAIGEGEDESITSQPPSQPPSAPSPSPQAPRPYIPGGGSAVTSTGQTLQTDG